MLKKMLLSSTIIPRISNGQMNGYFQGDANSSIDKWDVHKQMNEMGCNDCDETTLGELAGCDWWDVNCLAKEAESYVNKVATEYIDPNIKAQIDAQLKIEADKAIAQATAAATAAATQLVTAQVNDPAKQNTAIASTVQATADQVSKALIDAKEAFRTGGVKALYAKYPIPFYVAGGLVGLIGVKWTLGQVGKGKYKAMAKANPRKKRKSSKRKSKK